MNKHIYYDQQQKVPGHKQAENYTKYKNKMVKRQGMVKAPRKMLWGYKHTRRWSKWLSEACAMKNEVASCGSVYPLSIWDRSKDQEAASSNKVGMYHSPAD